jgi:hypothetical protein
MENYNENIVKTLKKEEANLIKKLEKAEKNNDFGNYLGAIKSFKATHELVSDCDWHDMHSVYQVKMPNEENYKDMVSIWEQNSDGNVRNHERYELVSRDNLANKSPIEDVKNELEEIDSALLTVANKLGNKDFENKIRENCAAILSCVNKL